MYKRILALAWPHWKLIALSLAASLIFVFFNSLSVWVTASFINNILTDFESLVKGQAQLEALEVRTVNETLKLWTNRLILGATPIDTLKVLCITIFVSFLMKNLFLYLKNFLTGLVQIKVITDLRNKLFDHLTTLSLSFFSRKKSGELTSILLNDVAAIRRSLAVSFQTAG